MKNRKLESLSPLFNYALTSLPYSNLILTGSTDIGVRRNLGRNGARFAPKAILNTLKKFNQHNFENKLDIIETSNQENEIENFEKAQLESADKIKIELLTNKQDKIIHIGGGHDHAFPLLQGLQLTKKYDNILIINIDAHCDTRVDEIHHSGTPFRNFDSNATIPFHIIQYGIHHFSNSKTTLNPLKNGSFEFIYMDQLTKETKSFQNSYPKLLTECPFDITERTALFLSLDCDAISGEQMKAVSAVNANGIPLRHVDELVQTLSSEHPGTSIFGLYEYNPVYDDVSQLGSRSLASLIYNFLNN